MSILLVWALGAAPAYAECRLEPGARRTVTRVVDGETLRLDDGSEVRLAGLVAPRGFDAGVADQDWPAAVAATGALAALADGRTVALGYSGTARRDRQGRHLAQVFVIEGAQETWVQGHLLREGHGRASQQRDARGCLADLLAHEYVARAAGAGVWAVAAYQMRRAAWTRDFEGLAARFVVLRGRIAWVAAGRETVALGFTPARAGPGGARWQARRGVIVMIDGRDRDLLGTFGGDAAALQGKDVEVRGWLEMRLGRPAGTYVMDVSLAGALVVADPSATAQ